MTGRLVNTLIKLIDEQKCKGTRVEQGWQGGFNVRNKGSGVDIIVTNNH